MEKTNHLKMCLLLRMVIFQCHVSFQGCMIINYQISSFPNKALFWGLVLKGGNVALEWGTLRFPWKKAGLKMKDEITRRHSLVAFMHLKNTFKRNAFQNSPSDELFGGVSLNPWLVGFPCGSENNSEMTGKPYCIYYLKNMQPTLISTWRIIPVSK